MDRREFLRNAGALAGAASVGGALSSGAAAAQADVGSSTREAGAVTMHLIGDWLIACDPSGDAREKGWTAQPAAEAVEAPVPGVVQMPFPNYRGIAWYWRKFTLPRSVGEGERVIIRFVGVDYLAQVYVNGKDLGTYEAARTPFVCDVSSAVQSEGENLLAVRVNFPPPRGQRADGIALEEIPHRGECGGIMDVVDLEIVPAVRVSDIFVRPDPATGDVAVTLTVRNDAGATAQAEVALAIAPAFGGPADAATTATVTAPAGNSVHEMALRVPEPHLWDIDDPYLYRLTASMNGHEQSVRCGFRDFRVVDGYFHLNGRRIFLKGAHTGNGFPYTGQIPVLPDDMRRDLINAKASGFNCIRFIMGPAVPMQLEFCDEIGLLVYEESFASVAWQLTEGPEVVARSERCLTAMILRDRNHPSVVIWGLLNECHDDNDIFRMAHPYLPKLRSMDPTRLVLLNSGRWDCLPHVGSLSNPGGTEWEYAWGSEGAGEPLKDPVITTTNYYPDRGWAAGDTHMYPGFPQDRAATTLIRSIGAGVKPMFLSEYGMGSQIDVIAAWQQFYEHNLTRDDTEDLKIARAQAQAFMADWERLGFGDVYASPRDMLRESQRLNARQRTLGFDCVRSNPHFIGFSLTSMVDWCLNGEGVWTFWREFKPEMFDALSDGWAPLRWCVFADPMHAYAGDEVTVEAVLANEDVLKPGQYKATFRIIGPAGVAWEKSDVFEVTDRFASPAMKETVRLYGPAGEYTLAATLDGGGMPRGGRLNFHLSRRDELPQLDAEVLTWGVSEEQRAWLTGHGVRCSELDLSKAPAAGGVIVVGFPAEEARTAEAFAAINERIEQGSTVVYLDPDTLAEGDDSTHWLPLEKRGKVEGFRDWVYHKEIVARRHPVFAGLQAPGVFDCEWWGGVVTNKVFEGLDAPDDLMAAWFAVGHPSCPSPWGYGQGVMLGAYRVGEGRLVVNTLRLLENLGTEPAADRLLLNLINQYARG